MFRERLLEENARMSSMKGLSLRPKELTGGSPGVLDLVHYSHTRIFSIRNDVRFICIIKAHQPVSVDSL